MTNLIELWDRDGEYKISLNPANIISMRALTVHEDDNHGTVIKITGDEELIVTNKYEEVLKMINDVTKT